MDGFLLAVWLVRIVFLILVYGVLFSVVRALTRDLRAAAREPTAEETEEGQDRVDQDGELALPNDETLGDLSDVEVLDNDNDDDDEETEAPALAEGELELEE